MANSLYIPCRGVILINWKLPGCVTLRSFAESSLYDGIYPLEHTQPLSPRKINIHSLLTLSSKSPTNKTGTLEQWNAKRIDVWKCWLRIELILHLKYSWAAKCPQACSKRNMLAKEMKLQNQLQKVDLKKMNKTFEAFPIRVAPGNWLIPNSSAVIVMTLFLGSPINYLNLDCIVSFYKTDLGILQKFTIIRGKF